MKVTLIGIDLAKSVFQVCGVNRAGKPVFNRQVRRAKLLEFLAQFPGVKIAMEACSGSNYWGRTFQARGHGVLLIPPQYVKPFVNGNKNDRNDALAICEASSRPKIRFVVPRSLAQTDTLLTHKILERRISERTALINQIRGVLNEYGVVVAKGKGKLRANLPFILEDTENGLTPVARQLLTTQLEAWRAMEQSIRILEKLIRQHAKQCEPARRLMAIKGVGEKIASATQAFIGNGAAYRNGRDFAANLGLVPKEHSSGGKQRLGTITKRGNQYLRRLLVQGAWSVLRYAARSDDRLSRWAGAVAARRGQHKAAIAVANKLSRLIWALLHHQTSYRPT